MESIKEGLRSQLGQFRPAVKKLSFENHSGQSLGTCCNWTFTGLLQYGAAKRRGFIARKFWRTPRQLDKGTRCY
jgi:hypothetical protein